VLGKQLLVALKVYKTSPKTSVSEKIYKIKLKEQQLPMKHKVSLDFKQVAHKNITQIFIGNKINEVFADQTNSHTPLVSHPSPPWASKHKKRDQSLHISA
jgi:hypothetical protein